jgi:EAL domain-containing protein (putative c-di-GMP-specific phosphodiesterase class I)
MGSPAHEAHRHSPRPIDGYWSARIHEALHDDRFTLAFQPIVGLGGEEPGHYEALVRLVDHAGAVVSASEFIPSAERCGLIHDIDRLVATAAIHRTATAQSLGHAVRCAINLSGLSLGEASILDHVEREIRSSGVDPDSITFEITETSAVVNFTHARRTMQALRALGCHFALDDFGKGFSSFMYLRMLPVEFLKIDGAFVRHVATSTVDWAMVHSINELAHQLGMRTIAECVETEEALRALDEIGVDFAQGYYIAPPSDLFMPVRSREPRAGVA